MATGFTASTPTITVAELAKHYRTGTPFGVALGHARMIPDGGSEAVSDAKAVGSHCAYCKRERGEFPTCDGCGAAEFT